MAAGPLSFTLRVAVHTNGLLLGGDVEQRGYLSHHASFGSAMQRIATNTPLAEDEKREVSLGPYTLPPLAAIRGDEMISVKQYALTRHSGIEQIDAKESTHVLRDQPAGDLHMAVVDLLNAAAGNKTFHADLVDSILELHDATMAFAQQQQQQPALSLATILARATKGQVRIAVDLHGGGSDARKLAATYAETMTQRREASERSPSAPLLYGTRRQVELMAKVQELVLASHSRYFFCNDDGRGAPVYPIGAEKSLENLHLVAYQSDYGWLPAAYYLCNTSASRDLPPGIDGRALVAEHAVTDEGRAFAEAQYQAALVRLNMTPAAFCTAIDEQLARPKSDAQTSDAYKLALRVIAQVCTYSANAALYHADQRFHAGAAAAPPGVRPAEVRQMRRDQRALAQRLHQTLFAAADGDNDAAVPVEDFGIGLSAGQTTSDDCEGSGALSVEVGDEDEAMALGAGAAPGKFPLLSAASKVLERRILFMAASSVTSAFFSNDGTRMTRATLTDLPLMGDAVDAKSEIAGHAHGIWMSEANAARMLALAGHCLEADLPALHTRLVEAAAWEFNDPTLVFEGTGANEPFVLPTEEVFATTPTATARRFYQTLRTSAPTVMNEFRLEGLPFYDARQDPRRRVSTFYRGVAFLASRKLKMMNPLYGTLAVVNTQTRTRGVDIGALLRHDAALGLVSPFALDPSLGRRVWDELVTPLAACIQNQMPLSVYARFTVPPRAPTPQSSTTIPINRLSVTHALLRMNHPLPLRVLRSLEQVQPASMLTVAFDRHRLGLQARAPTTPLAAAKRLTAAATGAAVPVPVVAVTLFSQPWRLAQPDVMVKVETELRALKKAGHLLDFTFVRNRPLAHCDDVIDLIVHVPQ